MRLLITGGSGFIGLNAVERFRPTAKALLNLDRNCPEPLDHRPFWQKTDLLDRPSLKEKVYTFQPTHVLHLAARADCVETTTVEEGYRDNTDGTSNFLGVVASCPSIQRAVITSSQYVCGPGYSPKSDEDYSPTTVYGASKVITERLTRAANLPFCWTLIRPTNVWGPWHARYEREFWRIAHRGWYFHPGGAPVRRAYAFVGNVLDHIEKIFSLSESVVGRKTFYVGDDTDDIWKWASGFFLALHGRTPPRIPRLLLRSMGKVGDGISRLTGRRFYIDSTRVDSMTTDYPIDMKEVFRVLGQGSFGLEQGILQTAWWLQHYRGWKLPKKTMMAMARSQSMINSP
jgi:nucleoside-diphosphate-sugar epimerase